MSQDITLTVDYHDRQCVIRRLDRLTSAEQMLNVPTSQADLKRVLKAAAQEATRRRASVIWVQESTTGWARMQQLVTPQAKFLLANVLQMPLPPKARRRKTDKI